MDEVKYLTKEEFTKEIDEICYSDRVKILAQMAPLVSNWDEVVGKTKIKLSSLYDFRYLFGYQVLIQ